MSRTARLSVLAGTVTGILVGAAMVATRHVVADVGLFTLAFLRYAIGVLGLAPWALAGRRVVIPLRDAGAIALLGIGQFAVLIALLNHGLADVTAGLSALLFATLPLMALLLAVTLGREASSAGKFAGCALAIVGVGLAGGGGAGGIAAVLAAAAVGALCAVFCRDYVAGYPPVQVCLLAMLVSVATLAPFALAERLSRGLPTPSPSGAFAVLFIGFASSLGYFTWLYALAHATVSRVCLFLALGPITAGGLGELLLDEPLTLGLVASLPLVIVGLWLAHRRAPPRSAVRPPPATKAL